MSDDGRLEIPICRITSTAIVLLIVGWWDGHRRSRRLHPV